MSEETMKPFMSERTKLGLEILEAAVLLGILGDALLRAAPWGLNVFLLITAIVAAMIALIYRRKREFWNVRTLSLHGALVLFAGLFVWRDSIELKVADCLAILGILAVLTLPALRLKPQISGVIHYAFGAFWSGINAAFAPFTLLLNDIKWKSIPQKGWTKHLIAVLRGVAIAAPILLVFGGLFMAADAVFQGIIEKTLNIDPALIFSHVILVGIFSWGFAGYLRASMFGVMEFDASTPTPKTAPLLSVTEIPQSETSSGETQKEAAPKPTWDWANLNNTALPKAFTLGTIEMTIVLGLINLLFLSFVIVQIPYLFGGFELVQQSENLKLADYARRGFGELVTVAALVLPILLTSHWLLRKDKPINEKIYRVLAGVQILLLFVIMISATQRLLILTGNLGYGLTTVRFYPMAVMIWLAIVFIWFGLTVLRGAREQFAWGALWSALFVLGTLHILNPDDFIARTNLRLMNEGRIFDGRYHQQLSDDAIPVILQNIDQMSFENQCLIKAKYAHRLEETGAETDFRAFNVSRWKVRNLLNQNQASFNTANCPVDTQYSPYRDFSD